MSDMGYAIPNAVTNMKFVCIDSSKRSIFNGWSPIVFKNDRGDERGVDYWTVREWIRGCASDSPDLIEFNKGLNAYNKATGGV